MGVGGLFFKTLITYITTAFMTYNGSAPGTSLGGSMSAVDCTVNVSRARNLGRFVMRHVNISATCVSSFVGNLGSNTGTNSSGGGTTCCTNVRVNRRVSGRVIGNVGRRMFNSSSAGAVSLGGFVTNFVANAANGGNLVAMRRTTRMTRAGVVTVGTGGVRGRCNPGGITNRGFLTTGGGGPKIMALPSNIRCGMVGRNGNPVPGSASVMGIGCRNGAVSNGMFSSSFGHNRTMSLHTGRIVGN